MNRTAITLAVLCLAACSKDAPPPANEVSNTETNTPQAPAPVPSLVGSWTVSQINGQAPNQVWPMTATITADRFVLTSECRKLGYDFHQDRNVIHLAPNAAASGNCGRPKSPAELLIEKPLSLANIAMFSNEGRSVEFSGPGGRVSMTRK
jgi:hypothetical protein